jgi:RimJ/RimL family protein N-acetyltransferase
MELREDQLELRPWREDDVPALVAACNDADIQRYIPVIPRPYTDAHARAFIAGESTPDLHESFAITHAGTLVGAIGITTNRMQSGTIGYWCVRDARGRGFTTHALRLLCRWALEELELERLELFTDPDNHASQRVAEKVGFQREGVLRSHLPHPGGLRRDSVMFSLLPGELR